MDDQGQAAFIEIILSSISPITRRTLMSVHQTLPIRNSSRTDRDIWLSMGQLLIAYGNHVYKLGDVKLSSNITRSAQGGLEKGPSLQTRSTNRKNMEKYARSKIYPSPSSGLEILPASVAQIRHMMMVGGLCFAG